MSRGEVAGRAGGIAPISPAFVAAPYDREPIARFSRDRFSTSPPSDKAAITDPGYVIAHFDYTMTGGADAEPRASVKVERLTFGNARRPSSVMLRR